MRNDVSFVLISLEGGKRFFKNNISLSNINFQIFGINGKDLRAEKYFKTMFSNDHKLLSPSEIGNRNSHIIAIESFLASSSNFCCILEDDVTVNSNIFFDLIKSLSLNSFDFIHLGGLEGLRINTVFKRYEKNKSVCAISKFELNTLWRACGYIINKKAAQEIIDAQEKDVLVSDNWSTLFKNKKLNYGFCKCVNHPELLENSLLQDERIALRKIRGSNHLRNLRRICSTLLVIIFSWLKK